VAIIGAGKIVEDAHLPVLKTKPGVSVSWITDHSSDRLQLLQKMYSVRPMAPEAALKALADVDICLIAVPLGARKSYLEACVQHQVAAYVEKPFAKTSSEHATELAAFPANAVAVGFQRRTYETIQTLRHIIESEMFGPLQSVQLTEATFSLSSGGANSFRSSAASAGGGITIESAIHSLDQILYATSANSIQTDSVSGIVRDRIDYQVSIDSRLTFASRPDVPVQVFLSRLENRTDSLDFTFERAKVRVPGKPSKPLLISTTASTGPNLLLETCGSSSFVPARSINQAFVAFWDTFIDGLHDGVVNFTSAAESKLTTQWIEQIYSRLGSGHE
jgi:predicted dehydrogenase